MVVPYDERWPGAFGRERGRLARLLGPAASAIHHIGSTSVTGLCSKPVLDILVETPDLRMIEACAPALVSAGYEARGEQGIGGRRCFSRRAGPEMKTHLHAFREGHPSARAHRLFRDYLRAHPETAAEYCALKRSLAGEHPGDPAAYQAGKGAFIARVGVRAEVWAADVSWTAGLRGST